VTVVPDSPVLAADAAVDLHLHTFASDGFWHPHDLIDYLATRQFRVAAVCDHDSQKSVIAARERATDRGIHLIPGVEMTCKWDNRPWHLLVYGIAPDNDTAEAKPLLDLVAYQERRNAEVAADARLRVERSGRPLPAYPAHLNGPNVLPVHVLRTMIAQKHVATLKEAAELVVALGGYFTTEVPLVDVVAAAHQAGGICVLAHPGRPDLGPVLDEPTLLRMLEVAPLDGLETNYRTYTDAVTQEFRDLATRHGLLLSTGSDSHGPGQPVDPRPWHAAWSRDLLTRLGFTVDASTGPDWQPGTDPDVAPPPQEPEAESTGQADA